MRSALSCGAAELHGSCRAAELHRASQLEYTVISKGVSDVIAEFGGAD
jgi:hypothetical protein